MKVDNAIIGGYGTSSRFAPLSYELPKALIKIRGKFYRETDKADYCKQGLKRNYIVSRMAKAERFEYL